MYRSFEEDSVYKHQGSRLSSQTPAYKDYSRCSYSSEIREVFRDTVMTFFSLRSRRLEVVGGERARERETISRVVYKASCWDCREYIGKTKRRFNDRKTEHLSASDYSNHSPAIAPRGGENSWWGCAARFSKSWPYFRPKNVIFHTRFLTWPLSRNYVIITKLESKQKILQIHFELAYFSFFLTHLELKR